MLITGPCCVDDQLRAELIEEILRFPGIVEVLAKGDNKVSFKLRSGMQVDVRTLPPDSYGAALQYFTGSKNHNVTLRQRALKQGYTLSEYGLFTLENNERVAGTTRRRNLRQAGARLHSAGAARELRRNRSRGQTHASQAGRARRHPRRSAHAHRRDRWTLHHRRDGRGRQRARLPVHRDHRPLQEPGLCQRTRRRAGRAAHPAHSCSQRRDRRHHHSGRHRGRHPGRRRHSTCRTPCWSRWTWSSPASTPCSARSRSR